MPTAQSRPESPPATAPRVVRPDQDTESRMTGKLALAATAKTSPTMKAIF
jgi:hypothetical protein